jgi:AcrR family transcriptional regulator
MYNRFFDHFTDALKPAFADAENVSGIDKFLVMVRRVIEYYALNKDYYIFSLIQVADQIDPRHNMVEQINRRGVNVRLLRCFLPGETDYPSLAMLAISTAIFYTALFHKGETPKEIRDLIADTERIISSGLNFDRKLIDSLDYEKLESLIGAVPAVNGTDLFKGIAAAVAEVGPWNASMEMVAHRSGLSKSGLYAHFKSKEDMLSRLFMGEFEHIALIMNAHIRKSSLPAEQLYLAILSVGDYLRSNPEILITLDWIRIRRVDIRFTVPYLIQDVFAKLRLGTGTVPETLTHWVLFLVVKMMLSKPRDMHFSRIPNGGFRILYRYIVLGIKGAVL